MKEEVDLTNADSDTDPSVDEVIRGFDQPVTDSDDSVLDFLDNDELPNEADTHTVQSSTAISSEPDSFFKSIDRAHGNDTETTESSIRGFTKPSKLVNPFSNLIKKDSNDLPPVSGKPVTTTQKDSLYGKQDIRQYMKGKSSQCDDSDDDIMVIKEVSGIRLLLWIAGKRGDGTAEWWDGGVVGRGGVVGQRGGKMAG